MDVNWGHMTEQMLNFTLEIIYLLTGEDYILVKTTGLYVISRNHPSGFGKFLANQSSKMVPPSPPLISEKDNKQKVLEVTNKIIELLTGEVPIRCQDVTVYFSMEEWEYLEGHKDLYKDAMLASQPTITSPDGSSNGNPPERWPRPLCSRDSTQEDLANPKQHQIEDEDVLTVKAEAYDEQEEPDVMDEEPCEEEEEEDALLEINTDGSTTINSPERCPRPLYSQDCTNEDLAVPHHHQGEDVITIKAEAYDEEEEPDVRDEESCEEEEEAILEINTDGSTTINPTERCPRPLYSREHQEIPHHHQFEDDGEEEVYTTAYEQCKEECPIEMNGEGLDVRRTLKGHLALSPYWDREDDRITEASLGEDQIIPPFRPGLNRLPSNHQESFLDNSLSLISDHHLGLHSADRTLGPANAEDTIHRKALRGNKLHLCPFCGKQFTTHANVVRHVRTHTGDRPYSCSLCGKSFTQKSILLNHQTVHTGDRPFPCPDCGKCFAKSSDVIRHRRVHTGERPYLCLECGKTFTQKFRLRNHQRFHNEERLSLLGLASRSNQFR